VAERSWDAIIWSAVTGVTVFQHGLIGLATADDETSRFENAATLVAALQS
jgi:hypothetical protein